MFLHVTCQFSLAICLLEGMWSSEGDSSLLSQGSPRDRTQVLRLGDKHPYPLSYLLRPLNSSLSDRVTHTVAKGQVNRALIAKGDTNSVWPLGLYG